MTIKDYKTDASKTDVYRNLQEHLDQLPIGFPPTESGVEIRLLKRLFTPEEAVIASKLNFSWSNLEPIESIYERIKSLGYSLEELENHLESMADKGAIMSSLKGGSKKYGNAILMIGIFEFQIDKLTEGFVKDIRQYTKEAWTKDLLKVPIPQTRVIPIGLEIEHENQIINYDNVKSLVNNSNGPFGVANCVCRQANDILGKSCKATDRRDVCLTIGLPAEMNIERGWAREVGKEEALELLKKNEEEGLIFQPGNSQRIDFICSCCTCCCEGLFHISRLPNPADFVMSNYYAEIDEDICTGCGSCLDRCQLKAIYQEDGISKVNTIRCIGCGNCVYVCPSEAITLVQKENVYEPPETLDQLYDMISEKKKKYKEREKKIELRKKRN